MHPGVPQPAAEAKYIEDCDQPGYTCSLVDATFPTLHGFHNGTKPTPAPLPMPPTASPPPSRTPPTPGPGLECKNTGYNQCGGSDGYTGPTYCPVSQGIQQVCHFESPQYSQCCSPNLAGCGGNEAYWLKIHSSATLPVESQSSMSHNHTHSYHKGTKCSTMCLVCIVTICIFACQQK